MPATPTNSLKRKRSQPCLSSPPPEPHDSPEQIQEQVQERLYWREDQKEQATQTALGLLHRTSKGPAPAWTGRGRSPYKLPVTAVLDKIRNQTARLEHFERELIIQQAELDDWIAEKRVCLASVAEQKARISMDRPQWAVVGLPKPSSTSRGRSSSPDKYLQALRNGKPSILSFAFAELQGDIPQSVSDLLERLIDNLGDGCIPAQYKDVIRKTQPYDPVPHSAYSTMPSRSQASQEILWSTVQKITTEARTCDRESRDEMAWSMDVNRPVLKLDTTSLANFSRIEYIQTQTVDEKCLQIYDDRASQRKKADFALSFSPQHPDIRKYYDQLKMPGHEGPTLSQMSDISTSHLGLYLGAEVKKPGGNENEAKGQLFTWLGSGIIKQRQLLSQNASSQPISETTMPLVGYTILGYRWEFYIAYGHGNKAKDDIYILGPLPRLNIGTSSYLEAFRLLQFDERVKRWAKDIYWPWFRDKILEPLKST